jgi:glucan 1,3-beta-glucosidase
MYALCLHHVLPYLTCSTQHEYQLFSKLELERSFDEHVSFACTHKSSLSSYASSNIWTVLGEWSAAPTDCARWLNGRGVGARWDGNWYDKSIYFGSCDGWSGDGSKFSDEYKAFLRKYWEVQVEVGEAVSGWIFWAWKVGILVFPLLVAKFLTYISQKQTEEAAEWSYSKGLDMGWIPRDPTNRQYPNICG